VKGPQHIANLSSANERRPDWRDQAKCARLPEAALEAMFWPPVGGSIRPAKAFCHGTDGTPECPVREQCLAWALTLSGNETDRGCWGGYSARELRKLRKGQAA
jgi:hypothetical protein